MSSCSGNGSYQGRTIGLPWQRECHHEVDTGDSYCHYTGRESSFSTGDFWNFGWGGSPWYRLGTIDKILKQVWKTITSSFDYPLPLFLGLKFNAQSRWEGGGNRAKLFATFSFWFFNFHPIRRIRFCSFTICFLADRRRWLWITSRKKRIS